MAKTLYLIKHDNQGSGGFLSPPGHPAHEYSVEGYYGGRIKPVNGPDLIAGIGYLIEDEYGNIADPGDSYGTHDCPKCGQRVQYASRYDAFCVVKSSPRWAYNPDCPEGGQHA